MTQDRDKGDMNTLRMATPEVSRDALQGYIEYQRAFLEAVEEQGKVANPFGWEGRFAQADRQARQSSGLDAEEVSKMRALCEDYCGRLSTAARLKEALEGGSLKTEVADTAQKRIEVLTSVELLRERYGDGWVTALESLKEELLDLHQRLNRRLT